MADLKMAAASVLTTVTETANTVTNLVTSIGTGAKMIQDYTSNAREQQLINIKISRVNYEEKLMADKAHELMTARQALKDFIGNDATKQSDVDSILAEYRRVLA